MTQYSISWDSYKSNVYSGFSKLQQNEEFVDMTLAAEGHLVKVHKSLMALASPYIKEMLHSAPCSHPIVFLNNIDHIILSYILEYIYTGEVQLPRKKIKEFVDAAKALHIRGIENVAPPENITSRKDTQEHLSHIVRKNSSDIDDTESDLHNINNSEIADANRNIDNIQQNNKAIFDHKITDLTTMSLQSSFLNIIGTARDITNNSNRERDYNIDISKIIKNFTSEESDVHIPITKEQNDESNQTVVLDKNHRNDLLLDITCAENIIATDQKVDNSFVEDIITNDYMEYQCNVDRADELNYINKNEPTYLNYNGSTIEVMTAANITKMETDTNDIGEMITPSTNRNYEQNNLGYQLLSNQNDNKIQILDDVNITNIVTKHSNRNMQNDNKIQILDDVNITNIVNKHSNRNMQNHDYNVDIQFPDPKNKDNKCEITISVNHLDIQPCNTSHACDNKIEPVISNIPVDQGPETNFPIYVLSKHKSLLLILNRYLYNLHHKSEKNKKRRWRCIDYRSDHCKAFIDTDNEKVARRENFHNHPFHDSKILRKGQENKVFTTIAEIESYVKEKKLV